MGRPGANRGEIMIPDLLLARRDIPGEDLLHSELKNLMYLTQQEIEEASGSRRDYLEGMLEAYSNIYRETYRISFARG